MSVRGPFGALFSLEVARTFRVMRWGLLIVAVLTIAVVMVGGEIGDRLVTITIGAFVLTIAPGGLAGRDKLRRTLVLLQRLPVSASTVVAAKFAVVALVFVPVSGFAALFAAEVLGLGLTGAVGVFFLFWVPATLANWLLVGLLLRIDQEKFAWVMVIAFVAIVLGGPVAEQNAAELTGHLRQTGILAVAVTTLGGVAFIALAGLAFWLACSGVRRYDPGRAEASY